MAASFYTYLRAHAIELRALILDIESPPNSLDGRSIAGRLIGKIRGAGQRINSEME
jgi:hypothetical protein